jgi:RNA polymerase sigma-70 factor, ECF subfamily
MGADARGRLLSSVPDAARPAFAARPDLDALLERAEAEAAAALAPTPLDPGLLGEALGLRAGAEGPGALAALRPADVYVAEGCARGLGPALVAFDRLFGPDLDAVIGKSPGLGLARDEFRQIVREHLFVAPPGRPPRVASYGGRGPFRAWVRVTAARLVIDLARRRDDAELPAEGAPGGGLRADPELAYLRQAYRHVLPAAVAEALAGLSVRQRNLLRQRYLQGLGADKLATMYGVHRATAFAWLDEARRALLEGTRQAVRRHAHGHELDSVMALLGSELEVSVRRMLGPSAEGEGAGPAAGG